MNDHLPPPFIPGESYLDRDGVYIVVAVDAGELIVERATGERSRADARIKARIHRNIVAEAARPKRVAASSQIRDSRSDARFSLADVLPVVANTIDALSTPDGGFIGHEAIVDSLVVNSGLRPLLEHLEATDRDHKPPAWWASNFVQWFSHHYTRGSLPGHHRFERTMIDGSWAYRCVVEARAK